MRKWIIPLAVMMVVPALGAAAPVVAGPVDEQLVEGHTVFSVLEVVNATTTNRTEYAAAVAVLVRDLHARNVDERFPGVLWFNDQYLVNPYNRSVNEKVVRYPCSGAVIAVNDGVADPRTPIATASYIESYFITDPNDHSWIVDKWSATIGGGPALVWSVAILNNQLTYGVPDDGTSNCPPYVDDALAACATLPKTVNGIGELSGGYMNQACSGDGLRARYNAVLYFYLEDLTVAGADKNHAVASTDVSGCQNGTDPRFPQQWPCVGTDDGEGNSHPYNPFDGLPICPNCAGRDNHGGSGASGLQYSHATRNIDLYYGAKVPPPSRTFRLVDIVGSAAPFHCHETTTLCLLGDVFGDDFYGDNDFPPQATPP